MADGGQWPENKPPHSGGMKCPPPCAVPGRACGLPIADCRVRIEGKKAKTRPGRSRTWGTQRVLAGGLVRRAPLTATRSAECGLRIETQKPKNSSAGGGRNPRDATVAHLAGGLVRRAPLTALRSAECRVQNAECGATTATASGLHRPGRRARGEIRVDSQDPALAACRRACRRYSANYGGGMPSTPSAGHDPSPRREACPQPARSPSRVFDLGGQTANILHQREDDRTLPAPEGHTDL